MLLPLGEAKPAKISSALLAFHVVAALILLDAAITFRTFLRIDDDPVSCLTLTLALIFPCLKLFTATRFMRLLATLKTKTVATITSDAIDALPNCNLLAARCWAEPHHLALVEDLENLNFNCDYRQEEETKEW